MSEKILDRVRKMLALANNEGATEGERDTALGMAHNLMAKYQLDMMDVEAHARDKDDPRMHVVSEGWGIIWCHQIRQAVATLFDCKYFMGQKINATRHKFHFIGREAAVTTAMLMAEWIVKATLRQADKHGGHRLKPEGRAFGFGVAKSLHWRVTDMMKTKDEELESEMMRAGTSLALVHEDEQEANDDFAEELGFQLTTRKGRKTNINVDAFAAGMKHGETINLSTQLANKAGTLKIS